jgi:hypothetical protein
MIQPLRAVFCVCSMATAITLLDTTASAQGRRGGGDDSRRRDEGRDRDEGGRDGERGRDFAERIRERFSSGGFGGGGFGGDFGGGFGGGGFGGDFGGGRGNPWGGESRGGDGGDNGSNSEAPQEKPRVTIDLPDAYLAGDLDGDGQIGFYEWRLWQKTGAAQFARWDANSDGFLTPRELTGVSPPSGGATSGAVASSSGEPRSSGPTNPFAVGGGARTPAPGSSPRPVASGPVSLDDANPDVLKAKNYFGLLDENKDGSIDEKEWDKSNRVKSMFKNAGIDLAQPMSSQQFIETYVRLSAT